MQELGVLYIHTHTNTHIHTAHTVIVSLTYSTYTKKERNVLYTHKPQNKSKLTCSSIREGNGPIHTAHDQICNLNSLPLSPSPSLSISLPLCILFLSPHLPPSLHSLPLFLSFSI